MNLFCPNCNAAIKNINFKGVTTLTCCPEIRISIGISEDLIRKLAFNKKSIFYFHYHYDECEYTEVFFKQNFYKTSYGTEINQENLNNLFKFCKEIFDNIHLV